MRKGEQRKLQILTAAERQFLTRGYLETTLADILAETGGTKGSFYHHFDSKFAVLDGIVEIRAARAFEAYKNSAPGEGLERLNALLYHALPFGQAQQDFLAVLLTLGNTAEGTLVFRRLQTVLRQRFLGELTNVLAALRAHGLAGFGHAQVAELGWDATMAYCLNTMVLAAQADETSAGQLMKHLDALRFLWERVLDLPYGSMEIISLEEMAVVIAAAAHKAAEACAQHAIA